MGLEATLVLGGLSKGEKLILERNLRETVSLNVCSCYYISLVNTIYHTRTEYHETCSRQSSLSPQPYASMLNQLTYHMIANALA